MCFLALVYKTIPDYPVVIAANRDEYRNRPGTAPTEIRPGVVAGLDPRAGGTWVGVNSHGVVVGVSNLRSGGPALPNTRSRGLLCLDLLMLPRASALAQAVRAQVRQHVYNGFNLLAAGPQTAWVASYLDKRLTVRQLDPGVHIIGNSLPDAGDDPKVARGRQLVDRPDDIEAAMKTLTKTCADHGMRGDGTDAICVHGEGHGTLSSSIIAVHGSDPSRSIHLYAEGNPCAAAYQDVSLLMRPHRGDEA